MKASIGVMRFELRCRTAAPAGQETWYRDRDYLELPGELVHRAEAAAEALTKAAIEAEAVNDLLAEWQRGSQ